MTRPNHESVNPQLFIFSTNKLLSDSLSHQALEHGLKAHHFDLSDTITVAPNDLIAWVLSDFNTAAASITAFISQFAPAKALIVFPVDRPHQSLLTAEEEIDRNNRYINKIINICRQRHLDLRVVAHHAVYSRDAVGEGSALQAITNILNSGAVPHLNAQPLYPLRVEAAAISLFKLWFNRGHRHQTVLLRGQLITSQDYNQALLKPGSTPAVPFSKVWTNGETLTFDDIMTIKTDKTDFLQTISSFYKPAIISPPIPPKPLPVKLPKPPSPPSTKTISRVPTPTTSWAKPIKFILIGLISTTLAYIIVAYGLYAMSLARAMQFDPQAGDSLSQVSNSLLSAQNRHQKLALPGLFSQYFDTQHSKTRQHILRKQVAHHTANAVAIIIGTKEGNPYKEISSAKLILRDIYELESRLTSDSESLKQLETIRQYLTLFPQLFPESQKITVLVLLQNSLELRPTGGFIGSIALVTVDRGKILNVETRNIYDMDSNLRGTVTPPAEVVSYLGESSWYFRDSNWNPNFTESAKAADWFLDKVWGSRSNLVIGLNTLSLQNLLRQMGGVTLPDGTTVNADNIIITALNSQDSAATNSQPEFHSLLFSSLINQLGNTSPAAQQAVVQGIYQSLVSGELTLSVGDNQLGIILDDLLLSGQIYRPACATDLPAPCFADHFHLNEANVGINKANYYLMRQLAHQTDILDGSIKHVHKVALQNTSPNNTWPAGSYKAYFRAHIPTAATNISVTINDQALNNQDIAISTQLGIRIIGWFHELASQSTADIIISYTINPPANINSYQLFIQKQPGLLPVDFTYNSTIRGLPAAVATQFDRHLFFPVQF